MPYTFENLTNVVETLVERLGLGKFSLYVMDYGAPVGYRLALRRPDQVQTLIVQNGNAYDEGLARVLGPDQASIGRMPGLKIERRFTFWSMRSQRAGSMRMVVTDQTLLDPTTWLVDQVGLDRAGNREIQMDLFYDYRTNVPLYPQFQAFFRKYQPPTLIVWGKNDFIFPPEGAAPYRRDLQNVETHLLDTGHFALETHGEEIASRIEEFLQKQKLAN